MLGTASNRGVVTQMSTFASSKKSDTERVYGLSFARILQRPHSGPLLLHTAAPQTPIVSPLTFFCNKTWNGPMKLWLHWALGIMWEVQKMSQKSTKNDQSILRCLPSGLTTVSNVSSFCCLLVKK